MSTVGSFGGAFFDYARDFPKALSWTPGSVERRPGQVVLERVMERADGQPVMGVSREDYAALLDEVGRVCRYHDARYMGHPLTIATPRGPCRIEVVL